MSKHNRNPIKYNEPLTYNSNQELEEEIGSVYIPKYGTILVNNLGTMLLTKTGKQPPIYEDDSGYLGCFIGSTNSPHHFLRLHRMVALAFIENPDDLPEVNHKDLNKKNNCVTNLEWVTTKQNNKHARAHGKMKGLKGSQNGRAKLTESQIIEIREKYNGAHGQIAELAREYNVSWSLIKWIVTNKNWKHI